MVQLIDPLIDVQKELFLAWPLDGAIAIRAVFCERQLILCFRQKLIDFL
jgi:hypothetical protein